MGLWCVVGGKSPRRVQPAYVPFPACRGLPAPSNGQACMRLDASFMWQGIDWSMVRKHTNFDHHLDEELPGELVMG